MDTEDYLITQFRKARRASYFAKYGVGYKRHGRIAYKIFRKYIKGRFAGKRITMEHMACYMLYRVIGEEVVFEDKHNGGMALATFMASEVGPLVNLLRHKGKVAFTARQLKDNEEFQGKVASARAMLGDSSIHTHARPLYLPDESRLRGSLTSDTASLRDEALIVLLRACGARSAAATAVRHDIHCEEGVGQFAGSLIVTVPSVKTSVQMTHKVVLLDNDAVVFRRWLDRRRRLTHLESPFLFVTSTVQPCDTSDVTQMLYKLGVCAGYDYGFFSSHSFRVGFANRTAARVYANGGTEQEVVDQLSGALTWSRKSKAVATYLDPNIKNYFGGGYGLSLEEFETLSPTHLHGLRELYAAQRRPLSWFCHPRERLFALCRHVGVEFDEHQQTARRNIGAALHVQSPLFRTFIDEVRERTDKPLGLLFSETVGCLLEFDDQFIEPRWLTTQPWRNQLVETLAVRRIPRDREPLLMREQQRKVHRLYNRRQGKLVERVLLGQPYDRMLHLGLLPNGKLVLLKVRPADRQLPLVLTLPWFDAATHFPVDDDSSADDEEEQDDDPLPDVDVDPPAIPVNERPQTQEPAATPQRVRASSSGVPRTPSTVASAPSQGPCSSQ